MEADSIREVQTMALWASFIVIIVGRMERQFVFRPVATSSLSIGWKAEALQSPKIMEVFPLGPLGEWDLIVMRETRRVNFSRVIAQASYPSHEQPSS